MNHKIYIEAEYMPVYDKIRIYIGRKTIGGEIEIAKQLEYEPSCPSATSPPTEYIDHDEAQRLMDSLWNCGIRPVQAKGSAGQLDAVKYHLEDMRKLAGVNE